MGIVWGFSGLLPGFESFIQFPSVLIEYSRCQMVFPIAYPETAAKDIRIQRIKMV